MDARARHRRPILLGVIMSSLVLAMSACAKTYVYRIEPTAVTDLSESWNDTDSRLVAQALIEQSLGSTWSNAYTDRHGGELPTVIVGDFHNRTMDHIPVNTFVNDLEQAFMNSGRVQVVARPGEERDDIRAERHDQQDHARPDTRSRPAEEIGARYMLQGELLSMEDEEGRERIVYYKVDATLIDLETNLKVWSGQHEIKKHVWRKPFGI